MFFASLSLPILGIIAVNFRGWFAISCRLCDQLLGLDPRFSRSQFDHCCDCLLVQFRDLFRYFVCYCQSCCPDVASQTPHLWFFSCGRLCTIHLSQGERLAPPLLVFPTTSRLASPLCGSPYFLCRGVFFKLLVASLLSVLSWFVFGFVDPYKGCRDLSGGQIALTKASLSGFWRFFCW